MPKLWYATTNKAKVLSLQRRLEEIGRAVANILFDIAA